MSVSLSTTEISAGSTTVPMTTNSVTLTPSGGRSPYTYAWSIVSDDGHGYLIEGAATASARVTISGLAVGMTGTCVIHCVCRDSTGLSATSGNVTATFFRESGGGEGPIGGGSQF